MTTAVILKMSEKIKEEIRYYKEWLRFLMVSVFSMSGFIMTLIFSTEVKYCYRINIDICDGNYIGVVTNECGTII